MSARWSWGVAVIATLVLAAVVVAFRPRADSREPDRIRLARPPHAGADAVPIARDGELPVRRTGPPPDAELLQAQAAAAVDAAGAGLAACREASREAVPAIDGPVEFAIAVDAGGRVLQARSRLGARALDACVAAALGPLPPPGRTVTTRVSVPLPP